MCPVQALSRVRVADLFNSKLLTAIKIALRVEIRTTEHDHELCGLLNDGDDEYGPRHH